jgi:hypothetical protein
VIACDPASAGAKPAGELVVLVPNPGGKPVPELREELTLSVTWIPTLVKGEPGGPIRNGMTYIVRPCIAPAKILERRSYASPGAIQLLVEPASVCSRELM